jgi:MFS family permease
MALACHCRSLTAFAKTLSPVFLLSLLTLVNVLNYVDRGIVPGAFDSLGAFIRADLGVVSTDVQIGMLQSFYIVGYALASVSFGHLVHFYGAFQLVAVGLLIWILSVLLCGFAPHFWVLVLGRVLSGVGEGSFQTVVPPFIDDHAPPAKRGLWLAIFFCAIPVGTALGNVYGGLVASALSWRWAFMLEGLAMVPAAALIWHLPVLKSGGAAAADEGAAPSPRATEGGGAQSNAALAAAAAAVGDAASALRLAAASPLRSGAAAPLIGGRPGGGDSPLPPQSADAGGGGGGAAAAAASPPAPSFFEELRMLLFDPLFMSVTLGYAGFAAVLAGLGSFGPAIVLVRRQVPPPMRAPLPPPPPPPLPRLTLCPHPSLPPRRRAWGSLAPKRRRASSLACASP